jgi:hypothetical protein
MTSIIFYIAIIAGIWGSFRKGFYDGILYGLIHKKAGTAIGSVRFRPYLYAGQAKCRGWGLIGSPGVMFLVITYLMYIYPANQDAKNYFHSIDHYYIIYLVGYSIILGYLYFGYKWIKEGYVDGIKNKKTLTYYHLQNGEKYFINSNKEKERVISKHKYFRGKKAVKTGIMRILLGSSYILIALLLFLDRDYYVGSSNKSIYPNAFEILKTYYKTNFPKEEKKEEIKIDNTKIRGDELDKLKVKDIDEKEFKKALEELKLK